MTINQYGVFEPSPGAIIAVDCASAYQTIILNNGIINAIGTSSKPITWTIPAANRNHQVSSTGTGIAAKYQLSQNLWCEILPTWLSNAAGTGSGSFGDSSLVITNASPNIAMTLEVPTLEQVNAPGRYWVNYGLGLIIMYNTTNISGTFTYSVKNLTFFGYGISSEANVAYNEFKAQYNSFNYMGANDYFSRGVINVKNKYAETLKANRLFKLTNSSFNHCVGGMVIGNVFGSKDDRINITNNAYNYVTATQNLFAIATFWRLPNGYLDFSDSTIATNAGCFRAVSYGTVNADQTGMRLLRLTGILPTLYDGYAPNVENPGLEIGWCNIKGVGGGTGSNLLDNLAGTESNPVRVHDNEFRFLFRTMNVNHDVVFEDNIVESTYHHGIYGPNSSKSEQVRNITIRRNRFVGAGVYDNPPAHAGYNNASWWDNVEFSQNTASNLNVAAWAFGDCGDIGSSSIPINTLITRARIHSNLSHTGGYWGAVDYNSYERHRIHLSVFDYNLDYAPVTPRSGGVAALQSTAFISGIPYNTSPSNNLAGVSIAFPSDLVTAKTLAYHAGARALSWDGGMPVALQQETGTFTAAGTNIGTIHPYRATVTDSAKSWSLDNSGNGPRTCWLRITSGVAAGEIRAILSNTATVLSVAPAWDPARIPQAGDSYEIWKPEVILTAADGSTVSAGVYLPDFAVVIDAGVDTADSGIDITSHYLTVDPLLINYQGTSTADLTPLNAALRSAGYEGRDIGANPLPSYTLTMKNSGSGVINNITPPPAFGCSAASCSGDFPLGTLFTFRATPSAGSSFGGWFGCDGLNTRGDCLLTLIGAATVTATFDPLLPVRIGVSYYPNIVEACAAADETGITLVEAQAVIFDGDLELNKGIHILGGLDAAYSTTPAGMTTVRGTITVGTGSLVADRLAIH